MIETPEFWLRPEHTFVVTKCEIAGVAAHTQFWIKLGIKLERRLLTIATHAFSPGHSRGWGRPVLQRSAPRIHVPLQLHSRDLHRWASRQSHELARLRYSRCGEQLLRRCNADCRAPYLQTRYDPCDP